MILKILPASVPEGSTKRAAASVMSILESVGFSGFGCGSGGGQAINVSARRERMRNDFFMGRPPVWYNHYILLSIVLQEFPDFRVISL